MVMSKVFIEDTEMQDIANAIREKNGTETQYLPSEMGGAIREMEISKGNPLKYVRQFASAFSKAVFPDNTELSLDLPNIGNNYTDGSYTFANTFEETKGISKITISGNENDNTLEFTAIFRKSSVKILDLTNFKMTHIFRAHNAFSMATNLEEILGILNLFDTTNVSYMFHETSKLKEVRFVENSIKLSLGFSNSPLLSDESIQSIINGLVTVGTAQTLTFHADVKAKLTEEQISAITSKNWNLA